MSDEKLTKPVPGADWNGWILLFCNLESGIGLISVCLPSLRQLAHHYLDNSRNASSTKSRQHSLAPNVCAGGSPSGREFGGQKGLPDGCGDMVLLSPSERAAGADDREWAGSARSMTWRARVTSRRRRRSAWRLVGGVLSADSWLSFEGSHVGGSLAQRKGDSPCKCNAAWLHAPRRKGSGSSLHT